MNDSPKYNVRNVIANLLRYISAIQSVQYWVARDITHPTDYNRRCVENAMMVKDIAWENLPYEAKNSIKHMSKHYTKEAG